MNLIEMVENIEDVELLLDEFRKNEILTNGKVKYIKSLIDKIKFIEKTYYSEKILIDYYEIKPLIKKLFNANDFYLYVQHHDYLLSFHNYSLFKLSNMSIYWTATTEKHIKNIYFIIYLILNEYIIINGEI